MGGWRLDSKLCVTLACMYVLAGRGTLIPGHVPCQCYKFFIVMNKLISQVVTVVGLVSEVTFGKLAGCPDLLVILYIGNYYYSVGSRV